MKKLPILSLTIVALASGASAQNKLLSPTYQVGKEYTISVNQDMEMDMAAIAQAAGQPAGAAKTTTKLTMEMVASCRKHDVEGQRIVTTRFANMKMDMNSMGMNMTYDSSAEGSAATPLGQALGPMIGKDFSIILDANDEVISVEGFDELAGATPGAPQMFDAEQIKQMMNPAAQLGIPEGGVSVGEKWKNDMDLNFGSQMGKLNTKFDLNYVKDEVVDGADCAVINYDAVMSMEIKQGGNAAAPNPVQMKMDSSKMAGTMKMDKTLRFAREGTTNMTMNMVMTNPADPSQSIKIPANIKQTFKLKSLKDL